MNKRLVSTSKFLSLVLRHQPEIVGMELDAEGWLPIDQLLHNAKKAGRPISIELLHEVVASNDKQRFSLSEDGLRIRANQGHSVESVDLNLQPTVPPDRLYHGTIAAFLPGIREKGLLKRSRNHVHLSADEATAMKVGARRGTPVILHVDASGMMRAGHNFYLSANGVWLTEAVPVSYIDFPER